MEIDKNFVPTTIYRHTTVGKTLIESMDILESSGKISKALKEETLQKFDVEILSNIRNGVKILTFEKAKLRNFRYSDGVWQLIFKEVEFFDSKGHKVTKASKLKIIAVDKFDPSEPAKVKLTDENGKIKTKNMRTMEVL